MKDHPSATAIQVIFAFQVALNKYTSLQTYFGDLLVRLVHYIFTQLKKDARLNLDFHQVGQLIFLYLPQVLRQKLHPRLQPRVSDIIKARKALIQAQIQYSLTQSEITQVVFLGGGLDPQSFNTAYHHPNVMVYELDRGPTMATKIQILSDFCDAYPEYGLEAHRMGGATLIGANAYFIDCDFTSMDLQQTLTRYGFDTQKPSLFIAEGLTPYLPNDALQALFQNITALMNTQSLFLTSFVCKPPGIVLKALLDTAGESYHSTLSNIDVSKLCAAQALCILEQFKPYHIPTDKPCDDMGESYFLLGKKPQDSMPELTQPELRPICFMPQKKPGQ